MDKLKRLAESLIPRKDRRLNNEFYNFYSLLKENETKSYEEIKEYQFEKLKSQVEKAYKLTDFYKRKYDGSGFDPRELKDIDDLNKIPTLTRDEVKKASKAMILKNIKHKIFYGYTSGTTGKPLEVYNDITSNSREWASICYQWERVGFKPIDGRVEFRGFIEKKKNYLFFPSRKVLRINIVKMNQNNIDSLIKKIKSSGYGFFHGYPSAIYKFAKILEKSGREINPKGILLASEVLYDWQIDLIDKIFPNSKKICHYGQAERVCLGAWDEERRYFFIPTYGLLEIDENNNEMIATGFINEVMPLIRYKLTDSIGGFHDKPLSSKKTLFPIIDKIHGRIEDYSYNFKGDMIPPAVVTFPFKKLKYIEACKIIQYSLCDFELLIEANENTQSLEEANKIINGLKKIYGKTVNIIPQFVDKISVDKSGKYKWIECKIKTFK